MWISRPLSCCRSRICYFRACKKEGFGVSSVLEVAGFDGCFRFRFFLTTDRIIFLYYRKETDQICYGHWRWVGGCIRVSVNEMGMNMMPAIVNQNQCSCRKIWFWFWVGEAQCPNVTSCLLSTLVRWLGILGIAYIRGWWARCPQDLKLCVLAVSAASLPFKHRQRLRQLVAWAKAAWVPVRNRHRPRRVSRRMLEK